MSKRGISRTSMRVRLAVAAAVLAGGGAAGVVALSAGHSGGLGAVEPAGYDQAAGRTLGYTSALSSAVKGFGESPGTSLMTLSHMKPVSSYWTQSWHRAVLVIQRGTVVAAGEGKITVKSANGTAKIWQVNRWTKTDNVGGTMTGLSAMTGGTTRVPSWWQINPHVNAIAKGDLVFVFGERENHTLKAQLVLFAAPAMTARPAATPKATMPTAAPTMTATMPTATPTTTMPTTTMPTTAMPTTGMPTTTMPTTGMPTATQPATAPVVAPSGAPSTFTGTNS
jgi:hypothetical protein